MSSRGSLKSAEKRFQRNNLKQEKQNLAITARDRILKIRKLANEKKMTMGQIAEMFHLTLPTIRRIVHRKSWRHI